MPVSFCLAMIVKNESARIERALKSALPLINSYVITDTGSTDDTVEKIKAFFDAHKIPGLVTHAPFEDWSQARNANLNAARTNAPGWGASYLLLMDADMELVVNDRAWADRLTGPSYDMYQVAGHLEYQNRRIVNVTSTGDYRGVTHEFLNIESAGCVSLAEAHFIDHADGANRPEKFKRDIKLLKGGLKAEPKNSRYYFYLAQSYRDAGQMENAIKWYKRRVEAGDWEEEQWYAQLMLAGVYLQQGDHNAFILNALTAYNMRPSRSESLYAMAHASRLKGDNASAVLFAEAALRTPPSNDALFIDRFATTIGPMEEFGICAFYVPGRKDDGFRVTDKLSILAGPYDAQRQCARQNMFWYLPRLVDVCPSFNWQTIEFDADKGWTALNPSVTLHRGAVRAIIRTVNYRMDEEGRYLINGTDGTANDSNPINTRNFLVNFNPDSLKYTPTGRVELLSPGNMPAPLFKPVIGFEDMRLFSRDGSLWTSSCVREMNAEGYCEQVLVPIEQRMGGTFLGGDVKRMLKEPRVYEKNWMPIVGLPGKGGEQLFMYRLGEVVDENGKTVVYNPPDFDTGQISGSSQVIKYGDGWLALVHEARALPDKPHKRYYYHRFVEFDFGFKVKYLSRPFVFNDKLIEFCAGLCWHPDGKRLVISYGWQDKEARIATVDDHEVRRLLWDQKSKSSLVSSRS